MKKTSTKHALLLSVLSLLLCASMLIGTTFAWFTDSVSSVNNIIKSGNLDVELYYQTEGQTTWAPVTESTNIFEKDALWEPGHTEVIKLKVVNVGSLALKYYLGVNVAEETGSVNMAGNDFLLSDYIKFGVVEGDQTYTRDQAVAAVDASANTLKVTYNSDEASLLAQNDGDTDEQVLTMVVYMPTTVGNEANHKTGAATPVIKLGVKLFATQFTYESDSFDNQYDADAYNRRVSTADEFVDALATGGSVLLMQDIQLDSFALIPAGKEVQLNLNGHTVTAASSDLWAVQNQGKLTIVGDGEFVGSYTAVYSNGDLTVNGGTFTASNGFGLMVDNIYGTEDSVAVINGGTFTGLGVYNPTDVTINGGTFNVGRDPDGATDFLSDKMTLFINPTFVGAPNNATVTLNGGTFNGDIYVYDDGITETVFTNNGANITGSIKDNS